MRSLAFLVLLLFLSGCVEEESGSDWTKACFEDGFCVGLEVMREDYERQMGLMFRESIAEDAGMFFVFENPYPYAFWMKNMQFPIDMIWLDENMTVVHVEVNVPPCANDPCPSYAPKAPAIYVLEVKAGKSLEHGVKDGSKIMLS